MISRNIIFVLFKKLILLDFIKLPENRLAAKANIVMLLPSRRSTESPIGRGIHKHLVSTNYRQNNPHYNGCSVVRQASMASP
jgi:hypothetical protein